MALHGAIQRQLRINDRFVYRTLQSARYEKDRRICKEMEVAAIADFKTRVHRRFPGVEFADARNRVSQALFHCISCHHEENADDNASQNILQARTIAVAPPKRTLRKVGKRNHSKEAINVAA